MMKQGQRASKTKSSAGIVAFRHGFNGLELLLVHPGGPFWRNKDAGSWSIPKGEIEQAEDPEQAARREFAEELGPAASISRLQALGEIRQRGGKRLIAFCGEGDFDTSRLASNTFEIEWPPRADDAKPFRKSTAPIGSISKPRRQRSCLDRSSSLTGWLSWDRDGWDQSEYETVMVSLAYGVPIQRS